MQFYGDLLSEILGESAPSSKKLQLKQNATEWSKTIVTDARDVYDRVSTEMGGLPQQKAVTLESATIRKWLVNSGALIRWTAHENMMMNGLTKDHKSQDNTSLEYCRTENRMYKETLRWLARHRRLNRNVRAGRNQSRLQRVHVPKSCTWRMKSCTTSLILWRKH